MSATTPAHDGAGSPATAPRSVQATATSPHLLELRDLSKTFGGVVANDAISFDVAAGSIAGLIGPNGSGKTTLFNSITGYHRLDRGSVRFAGRDLAGLDMAAIARLGLLRTFQQAHVYDGMSCIDNLAVSLSHTDEPWLAMLGRYGADVQRKALDVLEFVGLADERDTPAGTLSYGQRKLLEFAMTLMNEPKLLLLDEPTAGVNPRVVNRLVDRLRQANATLGITMIVIEHNIRVVMSLASRVHCLARGRLLASGTPEEIRSDPRVIEAYLGAH